MLTELRKNKFTQEELAKKIGLSRQALSNIETGKSIPSLKTVVKIAQALDVPIESLLDSFKAEGTKIFGKRQKLHCLVGFWRFSNARVFLKNPYLSLSFPMFCDIFCDINRRYLGFDIALSFSCRARVSPMRQPAKNRNMKKCAMGVSMKKTSREGR